MTSEARHVLTVTLTEANMHDLRQLLRLLFVEFPHVGGIPGRPLDRPLSVRADKGYDYETTRELLRESGITPHIPRRGSPEQGMGKHRWSVERTLSWLKQFRRLQIRWDRLAKRTEAFLTLASSLINCRMLTH